jgi:hypothetical protein
VSAAPPPMDEREVERIFGVLGPVLADRSMVLVGGQAVFVWAQRLGLVEAAGSDAGWLASKDIDFEGSAVAARASAKLLGGKARVPSFDHHRPLAAVVFFDDSPGIELAPGRLPRRIRHALPDVATRAPRSTACRLARGAARDLPSRRGARPWRRPLAAALPQAERRAQARAARAARKKPQRRKDQ